MINIYNNKACYEAMAEIESFLQKGVDKLSAKEERRLNELSDAVETWENKEFPCLDNFHTFSISSILNFPFNLSGASNT